jgi:hypothetical protein
MSVVESVAGSEGSESLDTLKLGRDVMLARHELARIESQAQKDAQR